MKTSKTAPAARAAGVCGRDARWLGVDATYGDGTRDLECGMARVTRLAHDDTRGSRGPTGAGPVARGRGFQGRTTNADVRLKRIV